MMVIDGDDNDLYELYGAVDEFYSEVPGDEGCINQHEVDEIIVYIPFAPSRHFHVSWRCLEFPSGRCVGDRHVPFD